MTSNIKTPTIKSAVGNEPSASATSVRQAINILSRKLGFTGHPTFAGLTLTDLTASRLIWTDASKVLASKDLVDLVAGTANEIDVADDGDGTITVGIVNPLIVAKGGSGAAAFTDHSILLGSDTQPFTALGLALNGQIPIGFQNSDPVLAFITGAANQITVTNGAGSIALSLPAALAIPGKLTAGSFASPTDVTNTREYGFEIHYSGNNYNATAIRARAHAVTTDTTAQFQGGLFQAANNDGIDVGVLNGLVAEAIGKSDANAATISTMRGALVGCEWGALDTVTDLHGLHIRIHTLNNAGAGSFGTACALTIENEAVGGNGQALTAGIQFVGTNLSAGNKAFTYGINFGNGVQYGSADMNLSAGEIHRAGVRFLKEDNTNYNIFFGSEAFNNDDGTYNVGLGYQAGYYNDTTGAKGNSNIYIGYKAGYGGAGGNTGKSNVAIGSSSLVANTSGYQNIAVGQISLFKNTEGHDNFALGRRSLYNNLIGDLNIAVGNDSLYNTTGDKNTGVGNYALYSNTSADGSVAIGYYAGYLSTGGRNVFIGYYAGSASTGADNILIGYQAGQYQGANSDRLVIDNQSRGSAAAELTNCLIYGVFHETPASQTLRLNLGNLYLGNPTHSDADDGGAVIQSFIREDGAGTASTAATITGSHDGADANDTDGKLVLATNLEGTGLVDHIKIDSAGDTYIGDGGTTNYTKIALDGTQTMVGTARVVRDVWVDAGGIRAPGANPAVLVSHGLLELPAWRFSDANLAARESISASFKLPPDMDMGVAPVLCVGWSTTTIYTNDATDNETIEWQVEYLYTQINESTAAGAEDTKTVSYTLTAPTAAEGLVNTPFAALDVPNANDVCMHIRLTRLSNGVGAGTDTIADDVELHGLVLQYTSNKLGT